MRRWIRPWLWPDTLAGRTTRVLLVCLLALHVGSVWVHESSLRGRDLASRETRLADGLAQAARALSALPEAERDRAAHALTTTALELHWRPGIAEDDAAEQEKLLAGLRQRLAVATGLPVLRLGWADADRHLLAGTVPLAAGGLLTFAAPVFQRGHAAPFDLAGLVSLAAMAIGIGLVAALLVRQLTRPLRDLAAAADRIGRDPAPATVAEDGPAEVRHAARAFNAMQDRIRRLLEDRIQALAAVGHDLRTPLARLRLRAGFLADAEARERIDADLDEMQRMVEATLAYLREGREAEEARPADLVALLRTVCDAAADAGGDVTLEAPPTLALPVRRTALRRALANLVENAVAHGGGARVTLRRDDQAVHIEVADDGPGIPEADLPRVTDPFVRLEGSRNRATGGVGLGLAIARRAVEANGGSLTLANRSAGGLSAMIALPAPLPITAAMSPPGQQRISDMVRQALIGMGLAAAVAAAALAQGGHSHGGGGRSMTMQHHMQLAPGADRAPSTAGYMAAMEAMMKDMPTITGDADRDFALQMIPHHQAAIDMAKVQLAHGKDAGMRRLATEVIVAQEKEIAELRAFLAR